MSSVHLLVCFIGVSYTAVYGNHEPLSVYFSLMVSSAPTLNTSGVKSAVDQALEVVHNDNTILPGHRLQYLGVLDTQVRVSFQLG